MLGSWGRTGHSAWQPSRPRLLLLQCLISAYACVAPPPPPRPPPPPLVSNWNFSSGRNGAGAVFDGGSLARPPQQRDSDTGFAARLRLMEHGRVGQPGWKTQSRAQRVAALTPDSDTVFGGSPEVDGAQRLQLRERRAQQLAALGPQAVLTASMESQFPE